MDQLLALRAFVRIVEAGSLARAADSLNLPRSTVSKLLQDLERHLGTKLIERTTRTMMVTPEGVAYRERAATLLGDLEEMDAALIHGRARPRGRLRVDIGSSHANLVLIPALPGFQALYPEIELVLGVSDRTVDLIGEGVDCVIRGGDLADTSLIARRLCALDFVTCAAPSYLAARGTPSDPAELEADHLGVTYFSASSSRPFPFRFHKGDEEYEISPRSITRVNESTALMTALLAGLGIGQTFECVARPFLEDGRLVRLLPEWARESHPIHLVYPSRRHPSARLRVFSDWVAGLFAEIDRSARSG